MAEIAVVDFQRGIRRWTSKGDCTEERAAKWLKNFVTYLIVSK